MGLFSGIRKVADSVLKSVPGVNIAYNAIDGVAEATGITGALNRMTNGPKPVTLPINTGGMHPTLTNSNYTTEAEEKRMKIANLRNSNPTDWFGKVKKWFLLKYYTAKGVVIGAGIVLGIVLLMVLGVVPIPNFGGRRW